MKFNEIKKNKDGRLVKPRDLNWRAMADLKKSGAAGSHGDKTKEIPRKAKHKDNLTTESPIEQDKDNPIAKPYVDTPEWKALHDMDDEIIQAYVKHKKNVSEADDNAPARLLGKAQAHLGYGLEMAQHVVKKDSFKAESMARVIIDGWPDTIDAIQNVYKQNGEHIEEKEEMCPEACCGVPVSECHCPPDCPHCDCNAVVKEDIDSRAHKAYQSMWHKSNPIGRNWLDPDDYDADAEGTHMITDTPTEMHIYKVPAKNYDEAFDKWLDSKGRQASDSEYYDSTKDYSSEHQYWGRIAPEEIEPEEESLTNEQIAGILEADFSVKNLDDYKAKIKTLYGLERYMQSDPELAQEVKKRYRQLAKWKIDHDQAQEENYEAQIYNGMKDIGETATAGSTSAGAIATVVNPPIAYHKTKQKGKHGAPKAPQKKKADGTAVNALDMGNNLMGGTPVKR
jgi:hypothetical protein